MNEMCPACGFSRWMPARRVGAAAIEHCVGCGVGRTWPRPDRHAQDFGGAGGGALRDEARTRWRAFARSQLDVLEPFRFSGVARPCLVDVGCSVGALVQEANVRGWRAVGFEPDWHACTLARRHAPVANSYFGTTSVLGNKVHVAVLSHVLEHVDDPVEFLHAIFGALAPGGVVLVVCPNKAGWIARVQGARWYGYAVEQHVWHFTPQALARVVAQAGFEAVEVRADRSMSYRSPVLPWFTQPLLDKVLQLAARIGLGDEGAVLGRRPTTSPAGCVR